MRSLVVVTRAPGSPGSKTRLADGIGAASSRRLQDAFLDDTVTWASSLDAARVLAVHPPEGTGAMTARAPGFRIAGQREASFGERMRGAVNAGFADGAGGPVVMIATDSPTVPESLVEQAWSAVSGSGGADAAVAPADDGGWVAIGARVALPPGCFDGVGWSAERTLEDTTHALRAAGLAVVHVDGWYDVDTRDDLDRLATELRQDGARALPATHAVLADIGML